MKWTEDNSRLQFETTGRKFYANGYVGIMENAENNDIAQGYDQGITIEDENGEADFNEDDFTKEERVELADYMIGLWTKFREVECK